MKHVKFAEDKIEYEWIYKEIPQRFKYNEVQSDDSDDLTIEEIKAISKSIGSKN